MQVDDLQTMTIDQLRDFCSNPSEFHKVKHADAFRVLITRLETEIIKPSSREKALATALRSMLIACGVLRAEVSISGPELICAVETFCDTGKVAH